MNKVLFIIGILAAVGVMLAQVVNWDTVTEEYKPITELLPKEYPLSSTVKATQPPPPVVDNIIAEPESAPEQNQYLITNMPRNPNSPEIDNGSYEWLVSLENICPPTHKDNLRTALENDGVIREDEERAIREICRIYSDARQQGAKQALRDFLNDSQR